MAYFEIILMVAAALTGLILLALVASSGPVSHRHPVHPFPGRSSAAPARPRSHPWPTPAVPSARTPRRLHGASRCSHHAVDWSQLMESPEEHASTVEARR